MGKRGLRYSLLVLATLILFGFIAFLNFTNSYRNQNITNTVPLSGTTVGSTSTIIPNKSTILSPSPLVVKHVIVIFLENENETHVLSNTSDDPYIRNVLIPNYSVAEKYVGISHPSLPNYLAFLAGTTFNVHNDTLATDSLNAKNLVDLLSARNITWKAYMESMPNTTGKEPWCTNGLYDTSDPVNGPGYLHKLDPFIYFTDIMQNLTRCESIVPLSEFNEDLANGNLPQFSFITPNALDDGHTTPNETNATVCPPSGTKLRCTDIWLSHFMPQIIGSKAFAHTVIFIVWDAAHPTTIPNNVIMIMVSPYAKKGFVENTTLYSHYSVLATIERIYSLGSLGRNDSTANVTSDMFVDNTIP